MSHLDPKFSIVIPVHDRGHHVAETLHSVLAQEGDDYEVLVVGDGSTVGSLEIIGDVRDPRVRIVCAGHGGAPAAHNLGIEQARGEFIVWIDSDDIHAPDAMRELRKTMARCPDADVYYGDLETIDDANPAQRWRTHYPDYHGTDLVPRLVHGNCLPSRGTTVRRELYERHRGYDGRFVLAHDYHMWSRLAESARFKKVGAVLCHRRQHGASQSYGSDRRYDAMVLLDMVDRYPPSRLYPGVGDDQAGRAEALSRTSATVEGLGELGMALRLAYAADAFGAGTRERLQALERKVGTGYQPTFSVVVTTYNRTRMLRDALESLDRQMFRDFEVILVNDAGEEVEPLLGQYRFRLTYVRQPRNLGPAAARNVAHRLANGECLVYLDDDDLFLPDHLQVLHQALRAHPGNAVYTDALVVIEAVDSSGERKVLEEGNPFFHQAYSRERLLVGNYIPINTFAWPRSLLAEVGGFDEGLSGLEDWDFLLRLASRTDFVHIAQTTVQVRMREAGEGDVRRSEKAQHEMGELHREIYSRHDDLGSEIVRRERARTLERLGATAEDHRLQMRDWADRHASPESQARAVRLIRQHAGSLPRVGVLVLDRNPDTRALRRTLDSLDSAHTGHAAVQAAVVRTMPLARDEAPLPQGCEVQVAEAGIVTALNRTVEALDCDWVVQVEAGEQFTRAGLLAVSQHLVGEGIHAVYADELMSGNDGALSALLRPDFNLDLLLSAPAAMARHWIFRKQALQALGGFPDGHGDCHELALILSLIDAGHLAGIDHCPEPLLITAPQVLSNREGEVSALLAHLRGRGYEQAVVEAPRAGCYRIRYGHACSPGVSIIIPSRNQFPLLQRCVESVLEKTSYRNYEVIIVDNGSTESDARTWLDGIEALGSQQLRVLRHPGCFDYAGMVNAAAAQARGDYLMLLDNDTAVVEGDWLGNLLNHAQRPEVGVVGAKLLRPNGTVDQAGLLLGLRGPADTAFVGERHDAPGYMHRLQVDQNYSAVSGSCLMIRRAVFEEVGGMSGGALRNAFADLDLCLSVRQAGYLVVWTPHAVLLHEGGASRAREDAASPEAKAAALAEARDAAYAKWLPLLPHDPAYNRNLSLEGRGFELESRSWLNPGALASDLPRALALPADRHGCGYYRVIHPARAMNGAAMADVRIGDRYLSPTELERLAPHAVLFQRQMLGPQVEAQRRMLGFSRVFKVAELDDYLPNVPLKSIHRGQLPNDVRKTMRAALKLMDRLVVSTDPLAEVLRDLHPDIRVSRNRLPVDWWGELSGRRRQGRRPRVGWAGGSSHRGDLEMVADVVQALAGEVEWVFMGMCPGRLRPYVHEFHPGVAIEDYPARLASLDLDLAIAPLEDNQFNRCKSNLRVLELGACGFPVVCSDVAAFQDGLPVTRVKPRFKDWTDAIRMHIHDLDAAAKAGDTLREAIHRDWMLDEASARAWLANWMPD